jgi:hypothetical protein
MCPYDSQLPQWNSIINSRKPSLIPIRNRIVTVKSLPKYIAKIDKYEDNERQHQIKLFL